MKVKFKVFRFDPGKDSKPHYDFFFVEADPNDRILDCLNRIRWEQDSSLSYRMSCAHGICGSDGLTINGSPALACQKLVKDCDYTNEISIEPLKFFRVIKDLNVDLEPFFERIKAIHPEKNEVTKTENTPEQEQLQTPEQRGLFDDAVKCILCACCVAACPVALEKEPEFIGPEAILRAHRYIFDSRVTDRVERMRVMEKPHGIWSCQTYYMCTRVCPKQIKVTEAILKTKKSIFQEFHSKKE